MSRAAPRTQICAEPFSWAVCCSSDAADSLEAMYSSGLSNLASQMFAQRCTILLLFLQLLASSKSLAPTAAAVANLIDSFYGEHKLRYGVARFALDNYMAPEATSAWTPSTPDKAELDNTLTYGEFDIGFLSELLDEYDAGHGTAFIDLGSGVGRCTLAAALLKPSWRLCRGIELLPKLTEFAALVHGDIVNDIVDGSSSSNSSSSSSSSRAMAACDFVTGDVMAADLSLEQFNLCFAYSTMWPAEGAGLFMQSLSRNLARTLRASAVVITTDKRLCVIDGFELIAVHEGPNRETGGSTAYVHRFKGRECYPT
jgi:Histone methylation protein DOT1